MASLSDTAFQTDAIRAERSLQRCSEDGVVKHRVLGRYYVAAMLFIFNIIYIWKSLNMSNVLNTAKHDYSFFSPAVEDWTPADHQTFFYAQFGGQICIQIPAALLIYVISSHKFLSAAVAISSIFHMLTPVAVNLYPKSLTAMLFIPLLLGEPLQIAVLSMWKDWAPPAERTKFVFISFSGVLLSVPFTFVLDFGRGLFATEESFYISGACGLGWSFLWFLTVTDTPSNNPQCSNSEQLSLQNNTRSTVKRRPKISEVPWKSILKSKPVFALCLIYFKIASSFVLVRLIIYIVAMKLHISDYLNNIVFLLIFAVLYAVILIISAMLTNFLMRKHPGIMRKFKKGILCKVIALHGILLLGTLTRNIISEVIFFCLSYFIFSMCLAGFMTNALDLSSKYVTIIGGFIVSFYILGAFLSNYYLQSLLTNIRENKKVLPYGIILLYEAGVTIFVAVVFCFWGSVEEQPWSLNTASSRKSENIEAHTMPEEHELARVT